ncbi:Protein YIF1A [Echinococcus granulosus]|uniref:Protein YIF1 n=1 Tax=Echinococcus granulosus TaxID=6210 RepID=A0A068WFK2_ECHGR|nr:Protein YIF1A [Echinococcus granulosus]CDS16434.1 protein YIF1A [Echinococcus granulosus]
MTYIPCHPIRLPCLRSVGLSCPLLVFFCVMELYSSPWGGQSANSSSGQFYAPPDVPPHTYPQQYYGPSSYQHSVPQSATFTPAEGHVFVNQFAQNVAMQYGSEAIGQGRQLVQEKVGKYFSLSKLKHYFAVDNAYVAGKLGILFFPFFHTRWDLQYDAMGVVSPRGDINSPDLYIPAMAFITYVVAAGVSLGVEGRFAPDLLGILSSQSFFWLILEVCMLTLALYLLNIQSSLGYLDLLAYCGYKFVHMITVVLVALVLSAPGYYFALVWTGLAFAFFQIRSLKLQVLPQADRQASLSPRRGVYFLVCTALFQPFIIWWLTSSVIPTTWSTAPVISV